MSARRSGDEGTAVVEFVLLAVVLLVPFLYAMLCVFEVQRAAYALTAASREAGRAMVTAPDGDSAHQRARGAADLVLEDHGVRSATSVDVDCASDPCLTPGSRVTVAMATSVRLPFLPHWRGGAPATIRVTTSHSEVVDAWREGRP